MQVNNTSNDDDADDDGSDGDARKVVVINIHVSF